MLPKLYLEKLSEQLVYDGDGFNKYFEKDGAVELAKDLGDSLDLIDSKQAKDVIERSYNDLYKKVYSQSDLSDEEWKGFVVEGLSDQHINLKNEYMSSHENVQEHENIKHIIGSSEYGETPYLVSERVGNFSLDMIVYGYDETNALDNWVEFGEDELGWEVPELPDEELEGEYYYAKGYFPVDLANVYMEEVNDRFVEKVRGVSEKENDRQNGFERE